LHWRWPQRSGGDGDDDGGATATGAGRAVVQERDWYLVRE